MKSRISNIAQIMNLTQTKMDDLLQGKKVSIPNLKILPEMLGFTKLLIAEPNGQVGDYAKPLSNGSRLHLQEYPNNQQYLHLDKYDPQKGLVSMIKHMLFETWSGPLLLIGTAPIIHRKRG